MCFRSSIRGERTLSRQFTDRSQRDGLRPEVKQRPCQRDRPQGKGPGKHEPCIARPDAAGETGSVRSSPAGRRLRSYFLRFESRHAHERARNLDG